jgi:prepilin peptidase CpaA
MNIIAVLIAALIASLTDVRKHKIPNALVAALFVVGLALQIASGPAAVLWALAAGCGAFALGALAFSTRMMGGGDVKFFIASVVTLGPADGCRFLIYTLICGGLLAVFVSLRRGSLRTVLVNVHASAVTFRAPVSSGKMPYAPAMLAASLLIAAHMFLPGLRFPL